MAIPAAEVSASEGPSGQLVRQLVEHCNAYRGAQAGRSLVQLAVTALPFLALCAAIIAAYDDAYWLSVALMVPAAGLLVRLFIIQHDCGHGSYFRSGRANDLVGRLISVITLTPYDYWRRSHAVHHATSGNLGRRGVGDVDTLTVREYRDLPPMRRFAYRLYRNPLVLLVFGAPFQFIVRQRIPLGLPRAVREGWRSILGNNLALAAIYGLFAILFGWQALALTYLPMFILAAWIGGWLFFIQHQFENTYWAEGESWNFHVAALEGSSYYVLPGILRWFTGNIGLHHIHHLCGKIPNYRLQECLDASPELQGMNRLTLGQSLKCLRLALWDEESKRLVSFADLGRAHATA